MNIDVKEYLLNAGVRPHLKKISADPDPSFAGMKKKALELLNERATELSELQRILFAEKKQKVLIVLQGMDTSGKDGTIRHVFRYVHPGGVHVAPFDRPTHIELAHDYLWRVHSKVPAHGEITVFDRSHYEDIVTVGIQKLKPESVWKKRYDHVNNFEQMLVDEGVTILKIFLHIDQDTQKERLNARLENREKHWKFDESDLRARSQWDEYMGAYEKVMEECNSSNSPWYIIPSNKRWFRNLLVASILVEKLNSLKMDYPKPSYDPLQYVVE